MLGVSGHSATKQSPSRAFSRKARNGTPPALLHPQKHKVMGRMDPERDQINRGFRVRLPCQGSYSKGNLATKLMPQLIAKLAATRHWRQSSAEVHFELPYAS